MGEILTERRRVEDEGRKVVNSFYTGRIRLVRETPADDGTV
jgi:hypothetical protein